MKINTKMMRRGLKLRKTYVTEIRDSHWSSRKHKTHTPKAVNVPTYDTNAINSIAQSNFARGSISASDEWLLTYCPKVISLESSIISSNRIRRGTSYESAVWGTGIPLGCQISHAYYFLFQFRQIQNIATHSWKKLTQLQSNLCGLRQRNIQSC